MLHVDNLSLQILKRVSFTLAENENLTILGNNGSGKTTLAKAIAHLLPTANVMFEGKTLGEFPARQRAEWINYIPAKLTMYDEYLTVRDYLALNVIDEANSAHIDTVSTLLGLDSLRHSRCRELSSGESALLLIGGAMIHRARYTILDEPTANLDQRKKVTLFRLLKESPYFQTKIIITHDLTLAYKLGYKVLYLEEGEVRFFGECADFFDPRHLETCFGNAVKNIEGNFVVNYDEAL